MNPFSHEDTANALTAPPQIEGNTGIFAALDLGTNNCRLLIARHVMYPGKPLPSLRVLDSYSKIVRLGEDVSLNGALTPDAMDRTLAALRHCKTKLEKYPVTQGRYVATEACRKAKNAQEFLNRVERELGLRIDIISAEDEAKLAFAGCSSLLREDVQYALVCDIGGGSTEFLWVEVMPVPGAAPRHRVIDWFSLPYGVMNLSEQFGGNRYVEMYFDDLVEKLMEKYHAFEAKHNILHHINTARTQMISTSGTVTTLAAVHLNLARYDRTRIDGVTLPMDAVRGAARALVTMRPSERFAHPCIGVERTDFIISGCAIFESIGKFWQLPNITIADRGVREGIILSFFEQP